MNDEPYNFYSRSPQPAGSVYYIACTATKRLKIGYTYGDPAARLKQLQIGSAADLRLIAFHPGTQDDEKGLHSKFADCRVRGEWFDMSEDLFDHLSWIIWATGAQYSDAGIEPPFWVVTGLRMIKDTVGAPLPEYLEKFV